MSFALGSSLAADHAHVPTSTMITQRKRKTLDDFFVSSGPNKSIKVLPPVCQVQHSDSVPGLEIHSDFVSASEEDAIVVFLEGQAWRTDLARRVIHYGGTYCCMPPRTATAEERQRIENTILKAQPMPSEFGFLTDRMIGRKLYTKAAIPKYCIVNEYNEAQGISAHVENFRFKSPVCGLTLCAGDWMRFHELVKPDDGSVRSGKAGEALRTGRKKDIWMPRRSLLVMKGEARERWQHEIVRSKRDRKTKDWKRVSLTFRTDKENE